MTNSPSAIPGAFNFQASQRDTGSAPRVSGTKAHVFFQPPRTPTASASSSLILSRSTTSIISNTTSISAAGQRSGARKRTLNDYNDVPTTQPSRTDDWEKVKTGERSYTEDWLPASPKPLANSRYQLAGGLDTPGQAATEVESHFAQTGYRRSLSDMEEERRGLDRNGAAGTQVDQSYFALDREANGRGRGYPDQRSNGWSKGAMSAIGGLVGKAIEFCKAGANAFSGFKAGGGQAYQVTNFDSVAKFEAVENEHNWESEKHGYERGGTPVPGRFPEEDFIPDYMDNPTPDDSPVRPSKRRQVSGGFRDEEIAKNWVVVPNPPSRSTLPPNRVLPRPTVYPNVSAPRRSLAPSRPASRAGSAPLRRSVAPRVSHAGSPALSVNRGASFASPRSPVHTSRIPRASPVRNVARPYESPVEAEAKRWKATKRREEREADESIRRLDAQLKAMIREGKEALGTKVEVLDDEME